MMKFCNACKAGCPSEDYYCWRCGTRLPGTHSNHITAHIPQFAGVEYEHCPDCGVGKLVREEGCVNCHVCGYSLCGA